MDIEKVSFSSASSITDGKATPVPVVARQSRFKRLVLRLFSNSRSGSGKRKCFGLHNSSSPQFLAHTLNTLKAVQDQTSAATPRDFSFQMFDTLDKLPISGHYAV